ncbi:MAG: hypothetical protein WBB76_10905 [Gaiellaceae bacterium]
MKKHVRYERPAKTKTPAKPATLAVAAAAPAASSSGGSSPAPLIISFGVALTLLALGLSFVPASRVPFAVGLRLERNRQTIVLVGLAIGVACALVGLLTALAG